MICLACRELSGVDVCWRCRWGLLDGAERLCSFGIVRSGFLHEGTARTLVHRLKYEAIRAAGVFLARELVDLVPGDARCLIPIPRTWWRTARYGIDPAAVLAQELSHLTAIPAITALESSAFTTHHAGRRRERRSVPRFTPTRRVPSGGVLVDDVVTTAITLEAAARSHQGGIIGAVTATVSV